MSNKVNLSAEVEDLFNQAYQLHVAGQLQGAVEIYHQCTQLEPRLDLAWENLGRCFADLGQQEKALSAFRRALELNPLYAELHFREGLALLALGKPLEARSSLAFASKLDPLAVDPLLALAHLDDTENALEDAADKLQRILTLLAPVTTENTARRVAILESLADLLNKLHRVDEAASTWETLLAIEPRNVRAMLQLGACYLDLLRHEDALTVLQAAQELGLNAKQHSVVLMSLLYRKDLSGADISTQHQKWGTKLLENQTPTRVQVPNKKSEPTHILPPSDEPSSAYKRDTRLRIGYLSSDFVCHAVSKFFLPVMAHHSRRVKTFLYFNRAEGDELSSSYRAFASQFRPVYHLSDDELAATIRNDNLDILIELNGHTLGNRLPALISKPAPVICSWLGYPATTGVPTIDYRLVDALTDPPGSESFCSEQLVRLPMGFNCFQPLTKLPDIAPLPALTRGYVTFGCSSNIRKITPACLTVWGTILQQLPNARLALKWRTFDLPEVRARVLDILRPLGISDERIEWWGYLPGQVQHLEFYNSIDIALDTYPYNGTTTICDALSMGVPVVSQYGATHVSRTSLSLLSRLGLTQYAVPDEAGYVAQALAIARDLTSLANLRLGLRGVLESSPLCAYDDFVQSLEETFIAIAHRATND